LRERLGTGGVEALAEAQIGDAETAAAQASGSAGVVMKKLGLAASPDLQMQ